MIFNIKSVTILILIISFFSSCSRNIPTPQERLNSLNSLMPADYKSEVINTSTYKFYSIKNIKSECKNINVYFEGDGLAWITRNRISSNPTPITPTAFKLMLTDESKCSIYLARACQYTNDSVCTKKDWTSHRFSKKIVESTNEAMNTLKNEYKNKTFTMIGYSGGAAIAALISNKREDVETLITIAGNLNTTLWTDIKNITPLNGLNPSDYTNNLKNINQYHLIGNDDNVIPKEILISYLNNFSDKSKIVYKTIDTTHSCCWENEFKKLIEGIN